MANDCRPTPEQILAEIQREERRARRGRLKVFLGYAGGVGKSFQMLDEGRRRRDRGEDVLVCALQPTYTPDVHEVLHKLEVIPLLRTGDAESIDVPKIVERRPQVVIIDGLAYDNPSGSPNAHRWEDVEQLLEAGISVIASVNVQYLEKHQHEIERITGKRAPCTIPEGFLDRSADEIVVVDAPTASHLLRGAVDEEKAAMLAAENKRSRLRELALLVAAGVVDRQLESYLRSHGVDQPWSVQERIMVCVTPRSNAVPMLESGRRNAGRFQAEFYAVYVHQPAISQKDREVLEQNLDLARQMGAQVEMLSGLDAADAILTFAKEKGITQIFIGHSSKEGAWRRLWSSLVDRLIRSAEGIDVNVFPQ